MSKIDSTRDALLDAITETIPEVRRMNNYIVRANGLLTLTQALRQLEGGEAPTLTASEAVAETPGEAQ